MSRLFLVAMMAGLLTGCLGAQYKPAPPSPDRETVPQGNNKAKTAPYEVFGRVYYPITDATGYRERGVASWYGGKFHGRRTANGERYDMHGLTAAHKTLPLPTWVRVTNLRNGATVTVRVNDRGPFVKNRLIDLSYAAARQIGMVDDGTTLVEVEVIDAMAPATTVATTMTAGSAASPAESTPAWAATEQPATPPPAGAIAPLPPAIYVQVGAFGEPENAQRMRDTLLGSGIDEVRLSGADIDGVAVHRVRIGPVRGVTEYDALIVQLDALGIYDTHLITE